MTGYGPLMASTKAGLSETRRSRLNHTTDTGTKDFVWQGSFNSCIQCKERMFGETRYCDSSAGVQLLLNVAEVIHLKAGLLPLRW